MARLIYLMNTSLDGYVEDTQGSFDWTAPDGEINDYINSLTSSFGAYLNGRKMYDAMVFWEKDYLAHNLPQFSLDYARMWQAAEKIVYSTTLAGPRSARTRIERTFAPASVQRLKAASAHDMSINGPEIAAHALRAGLVDEVQMFIHPIVVGGGKPFFPHGLRLNLKLLEERVFSNQVVTVRYAVRS